MIEKKIILIGVRNFSSEKKQKSYYLVDYIVKKDNIYTPKTDYIETEEYNRIASKMKGNLTEVIGLFSINEYNKAYLSDIKA